MLPAGVTVSQNGPCRNVTTLLVDTFQLCVGELPDWPQEARYVPSKANHHKDDCKAGTLSPLLLFSMGPRLGSS